MGHSVALDVENDGHHVSLKWNRFEEQAEHSLD